MEHPLNTFIDHTLLRPDTTRSEIATLCEQAEQYQFAAACLPPLWAKYARTLLKKAKLCCVVDFPLGSNTTETKSFEAYQLAQLGVEEIDMVMALGALKSGDFDYVLRDIRAVVQDASPAIVKVIIETCLLNTDEKRQAARLCIDAGAHFVKTSTGFSKAGATVEDVALIRNIVGSEIGIKASGGIRDRKTALAMIETGATRIGTSSGIAIISQAL